MNFGDLTPKQREAVEATEKRVLVTGGAGAGKTTVALWAARRHLKRKSASEGERVLFVTFSRTAVGQISRRSRSAMTGLEDRVEVHTFHSLAFRLLRAFGRYSGRGTDEIKMESMARSKLLGHDRDRLSYDDLIPGALDLLKSKVVSELVAQRWTLVICDEFQDTSDDQWNLLQALSQNGRLLVLADPHQMIYSFLPTVDSSRLDDTRKVVDRVIELEEASHRDPSGVIPAMASAVRRRNFEHPAISAALEAGRLKVRSCGDADALETVVSEIDRHRKERRRQIGVFETTNASVAQLGAELTDQGIDYTLVGLPEAHGEAMMAMAYLVAVGLGARDWEDAELQLGVFLTSASRDKEAPLVAQQMAGASGMRTLIREHLDELREALRLASDDDDLIRIAVEGWPGLRITAGVSAWYRAGISFAALARRVLGVRLPDDERGENLIDACEQVQIESALTSDVPLLNPIQLMNFHQTKGREADAVILVYREGGWVTKRGATEPFASESRVLYVALTRARESVTILVPPEPHEFIAPLVSLAS